MPLVVGVEVLVQSGKYSV